MELQTLRFFRTVAEEGSYSAAAEKLAYAQSNLSSRIRQLETECGAPLFKRHKNGVTLTEKGELLFEYSIRILNLADEMEKEVKDGGSMAGILPIGSMESAAFSLLPSILADYHTKYPDPEVVVRTGTSASLVKALEKHEIDGAFVASEIRRNGCASVFVRREELVLISAAAQKNLPLEDLLAKTRLVFPIGCSYRRILEELAARSGVIADGTIEFSSLGAIIASVSAGLGVSLFPRSAVQFYSEKQNLFCHEIPKDIRAVDINFIYRDGEYLTNALRGFIRLLKTDGRIFSV